MNSIIFNLLILAAVLITGIIYGIFLFRNKLFPLKIIKGIFKSIKKDKYGRWAIGIYKGTSPFDLKPVKDIVNPVLTKNDITDIDAELVADPFLVVKNDRYYIFFEVLDRVTKQGVFAYADSENLKDWNYGKVIISEEFHLSYPYIFEWENEYYIIPESGSDLSVRLYRAISFPEKWEFVGTILSGCGYQDNSIFRYDNKWWLFTSPGTRAALSLYFSENLFSGWKPHPSNPLRNHDTKYSRPGGRVITYNDKIYRFAQDCTSEYGIQVFAFEISELSEETYAEKLVSDTPIITKAGGKGWNSNGMHHVDVQRIGDEWVAMVDGRSK